MFLHVTNAKYIGDYIIWIEFNDGTSGEVDLSNELIGQIFKPLKNKEYLRSFKIQGNTLSWDNGADFAPEFLQECMVNCVTGNEKK